MTAARCDNRIDRTARDRTARDRTARTAAARLCIHPPSLIERRRPRLSEATNDIPEQELMQKQRHGACHFIACGRMYFMNASPAGDDSFLRWMSPIRNIGGAGVA